MKITATEYEKGQWEISWVEKSKNYRNETTEGEGCIITCKAKNENAALRKALIYVIKNTMRLADKIGV